MRARRGFGAAAALCLSLFGAGMLAPLPVAAADLTTQGLSTWADSLGTVHVMGEVVNSGTQNYKSVMVACQLVDTDGKTLTDTVPIEANILKGSSVPAEKAPFDALFFTGPGYSQPACSVTGAGTALQPNHLFSAVIDAVTVTSDGAQHVTGTLTNNNGVAEGNIKVVLTSYDASGSGAVVDEGVVTVEGPVDGNGGTASFDLNSNLRPWDTNVAHYATLSETPAPDVMLSATSLGFGDQVQGTGSAPQTIYVNNFGTADLHVASLTLAGTNGPDYSSGAVDRCSGVTVAPGGSCSVALRFTPQGVGASAASLLLNDDASNSPQTVALTGNGLKRPALSLSPGAIDFGSLMAGTSSSTQLQLTSSGLDPVSIGAITLDNTDDFAVDPSSCVSTLAPGASCQVTVTFHPRADGSRAGTLTITHNGRGSPALVALSGAGTHAVPGASLSPDHLTFGAQLVGSASSQGVTLSNGGTATLSIATIKTTGDYSQSNTCGSSLAPASSCTITVTFVPAAVGDRPGTLSVSDNADGGTQSMVLAGTGITETDFYFAEGFTGPGFQETLSLMMPNHGGKATIDYYLAGGAHSTQFVDLTAGQVAPVDVNQAVGPNQEVSVRVKLPFPGVAERIMHFRMGQWYGSTDIVGVTHPASEWDFAEGSTLGIFSEYLTLQNPSAGAVTVDLHYFTDRNGPSTRTVTLLPTSRTTIAVFSDPNYGVGPGIVGVSVQVVARDGAQIIAERPFYVNGFSFGSGSIRDGHVAFGANAPAKTWNFAEGTTLPGFNEYLTLENPGNSDASVTLNYIDDHGNATVKGLTVRQQTRATVQVFDATLGVGPDHAGVSVQVVSDQPIVAERPMYMVRDFGSGRVAGATVVVGSTSLANLFGFADASTVAGENDFLTIQNPGTSLAKVKITYFVNGTPTGVPVNVPANTRQTVQVFGSASQGGIGPGVSAAGVVISSDQPILVEKPTYSANTNTFGATDTLGYSPAGF